MIIGGNGKVEVGSHSVKSDKKGEKPKLPTKMFVSAKLLSTCSVPLPQLRLGSHIDGGSILQV